MKNIKKMIIGLMLGTMLVSLTGCQWGAKNFGGDYTYELPKGEKLINVDWKEDSLWYLTEPMDKDDVPKTYKFQADTTFGIFEGTVTIKESK